MKNNQTTKFNGRATHTLYSINTTIFGTAVANAMAAVGFLMQYYKRERECDDVNFHDVILCE